MFSKLKMEQASSSVSPPHVLIFPLPAQGHVGSMLKLAEILALAGLKITFLNSERNHQRLVQFTTIHARSDNYPSGFLFETISDGLPENHSLTGGGSLIEMFDAMEKTTKPLLKDMLSNKLEHVDCIIGDGVMGFVGDVARDLGIPLLSFRTSSPCSFWANFCIPRMIQAAELPIKDLDRPVTSVPGMETFIRCRDLPSFCRPTKLDDPMFQLLVRETRKNMEAGSLILNTFEELEGSILSHIKVNCPNVYAIGPVHEQLKTRMKLQNHCFSDSLTSLLEVDKSCISWLDKQPPQSVLYASFGSISAITREQMMEFWYGLVNSGKRFLWVIRPDFVIDGKESTQNELVEATKERGYMVEWAPQEEVLRHAAVGGFLTHSGWNSTLESVAAGVPMICWPYFADQQLNSRFVSEVWKLGLDMKDTCKRNIVEKFVNHLMVDRRDEFLKSAGRMARLAKESVSEGGSSYSNFNRLIQDIWLMKR